MTFLPSPSFKTGIHFRGQVYENGCGKLHFYYSEIGPGFGEPGGAPPPRTPRSTPRARLKQTARVRVYNATSERACSVKARIDLQ